MGEAADAQSACCQYRGKGWIRFVRHFGKNSFKIMERVFFLEKGDLFFIDL